MVFVAYNIVICCDCPGCKEYLFLQSRLFYITNTTMRSFIFSLIIIIFSAIYSQTICAQQRDIVLTGTVTDHQGEPLPDVTIRVRNTQFGTVTDADGRYLLRGRWEEGDIVIFSFIRNEECPCEVCRTKGTGCCYAAGYPIIRRGGSSCPS